MLKREDPVPAPLVMGVDLSNRLGPGACVGVPFLAVSRPVLKRLELSLGARLEKELWPRPLNRPPLCGAEDEAAGDGCVDVKLPNGVVLLAGTAKRFCVEDFEGPAELDCSAKMDFGRADSFG